VKTISKTLFVFLVSTSFILGAASAEELRHRLAAWAGIDTWLSPVKGFHLAYQASYDLDHLVLDSHLGIYYNTDTARLAWDRLTFCNGLLETGIRASWERNFAGLLLDYWQRGIEDTSRGIKASYFAGEIYLKANLPHDSYLELNTGIRRWIFGRLGSTNPALVLPPNAWVFEPRLRYTWWNLQHDAAFVDAHRMFPRIVGLAAGLDLGLDLRSETAAWGDPADPRNDPGSLIFMLRQWFRAGWQLHPVLRTQLFQVASYGHAEDDLTRARVGGLNPYVVPLAGAPWAAFISEKFLSLESSWHVRIFDQIEAGILLQGILIEDVTREGRIDTYDFLFGLGAFIDARFWGFQLDIRAGWSPSIDWQSSSGQFGLYCGLGWQWDSGQ
jgi:hypothetical protein